MEQPSSFATGNNLVCKLYKALYGLKQARQAWFQKLSSIVQSMGFANSKANSSLFIFNALLGTLFILIHVDDIIIIGSNPDLVSKVIQHLQSKFALKNLGFLYYFLGIAVLSDESSLHLSQTKYIKSLISKRGLLQGKLMSSHHMLSKKDGQPLVDPSKYLSLIGAL